MEIKPGWEPITEVDPSDSFACNYGGNFAQKLLINRGAVEKFLRIAAIDGQVILGENKQRTPQSAPDINSDGSITGKGRIRWGEVLHLDKDPKAKELKVTAAQGNWLIDINGDLIRDDLMKKTQLGVREIEDKFASKVDGLVKTGLSSVLVKDKLTFKGDPFFTGRILATSFIFSDYIRLATDFREERIIGNCISLGIDLVLLYIYNRINREINDDFFQRQKSGSFDTNPLLPFLTKIIYYGRRSNNNLAESLSIPFELDRIVLSSGYLLSKNITRQPLVKLAD